MITELENSFLYFCQTDEEENYFKNALIYLCKNDEEGSFGIIINKKVKIQMLTLLVHHLKQYTM